jgi:hypothetical protein
VVRRDVHGCGHKLLAGRKRQALCQEAPSIHAMVRESKGKGRSWWRTLPVSIGCIGKELVRCTRYTFPSVFCTIYAYILHSYFVLPCKWQGPGVNNRQMDCNVTNHMSLWASTTMVIS